MFRKKHVEHMMVSTMKLVHLISKPNLYPDSIMWSYKHRMRDIMTFQSKMDRIPIESPKKTCEAHDGFNDLACPFDQLTKSLFWKSHVVTWTSHEGYHDLPVKNGQDFNRVSGKNMWST